VREKKNRIQEKKKGPDHLTTCRRVFSQKRLWVSTAKKEKSSKKRGKLLRGRGREAKEINLFHY